MFTDYFKIAWRSVVRNKFNTVINIAGLTLGITCFLVILAKITYENGFDRFHTDSDRIYRIVRVTQGLAYLEGELEYRPGVFFALPNAIRSQIPELEATTQMFYGGGGVVRVFDTKGGDQQAIFKEAKGVVIVEPEFFDVFDFSGADFNWIMGAPRESLGEPYSAVLTKTLANKYFGDENPVGRSIEAMGFKLQVTGVVSDFPQNTDFPFQLLISFSTLQTANSNLFNDWGNLSDNFQCYVKIKRGVDDLQIEEKIKKIHSDHTTPQMAESRLFKLQPLGQVHNERQFGNYNNRVMSRAAVFSLMSIGFLLIVIACINHSNLTVAQLSSRAKVAGICKVFGGNRKRLMLQFLGETFILTAAAMVLSIGFSNIILQNLNNLIGLPQHGWRFLGLESVWLLAGVVVAVSVFAGIYPAFLISRANPVEMIRNKGFKPGKAGLRASRLAVIFQFIIAQILIVCTIVIFRQLAFIESKDMGYERENIITVGLPDDNSAARERFRHELMRNPEVAEISFASTSPCRSRNWTDVSRVVNSSRITTVTETKSVDSSYIHTYGLKLVSGHNFSDRESGLPIIVNQKLLRDLHFADEYEAVGATVEFYGQDAVIIGVVKDFHSDPIYETIRPCVLESTSRRFNMAGVKYYLASDGKRFHTQMEGVINDIQKHWQAVYPGQIFEYQFFDETIASYYREEEKTASLINIFTGVMIFICCLGMIGLIYHTTNRKSKELAVRKVVGALARNIFSLLVRSFAKWALIANLISWPIAWYAMNKWLQNFAYRIDLSWWMFALAGGIALTIALLTVSWQAIRAARANPIKALRYE